MSRRYPSNAEPIQFLQAPRDFAHALPQGREAGGASGADAGDGGLALQNLMRAACWGDPRAQFDLGVEAMRRIVEGR